MKCPHCQAANPEGKKFCRACGMHLLLTCRHCGSRNLLQDNFCGECGLLLEKAVTVETKAPKSERKYVTILFSDLSGYTALAERLDPEEVNEIMNRLFGEIAQVITTYEGFIEKFIGDAVMVIFGTPKAHEDDPARAVYAALQIHDVVSTISPQWEKKVGRKLLMHSGISTGLVVTASVNPKRGTYGISGDTINLASRLEGCAGAGEILVDAVTYQQTKGYFIFTALGPRKVKGKTAAIISYKVVALKERPCKVHRTQGLRAALIGREKEMATFAKAVEQLRKGKGSLISICGDTGTGKSRLVEEFKASLEQKEIAWQEGYAYAYAQNISYAPFRDLLNQVFQVEESDTPQIIREKVESRVESLVGKKEHIVPYVGSLYAISYPETHNLDPELCKSRLHEAIKSVIGALAKWKPTVILFEDLHWADPSSRELFRAIIADLSNTVLFICTSRPTFHLNGGREVLGAHTLYQEITLHDLSSEKIKAMLYSLLKTTAIPSDLEHFLEERIEGNPFYVEEIINALAESGILIRSNGSWKLTRTIRKSDIPLTVSGVIAARIDRLEPTMKRILQEASVIGKSFPYAILGKITDREKHLRSSLDELERLDLIRLKSPLPVLEYGFKHALIQEVMYNSLLKKERQEIHERIGHVMGELFPERLPELFETLAFHFKNGKSRFKAVEYLMQSGKKSLNRYAVVESHQYYKEAYELLTGEVPETDAVKSMLIQLLNSWTPVFYFRGNFRDLGKLLTQYITLVESLDDKERRGMFYVCLGISFWAAEKFNDSYHYLQKALKHGEETGNKQITSHAYAWLGWTSAELGLPQEALHCGEKARQMSVDVNWEHCPNYHSWDSDGYACWVLGACSQIRTLGKTLLDHGEMTSSIRCITWGHTLTAWSSMMSGDFPSAIRCNKMALQTSTDPLYTQFPRLCLGMSYVSHGDFTKAKQPLKEVLDFSRRLGCEYIGTPAQCFLSVVLVAEGKFAQGFKMLKGAQRQWLEHNAPWRYTFSELIFGELFSAMARRATPTSFASIVKNIGFLAKNLPFARQHAEAHFKKAIASAQKVGAKGMEGQAHLGLGKLHSSTGNNAKARDCFSSAIQLFKECEAETFLKKAHEGLSSL